MKALNHPNIIKLHDVFFDNVNKNLDIEYGLGAIKGVADSFIDHVLDVRQNQSFKDLFDFTGSKEVHAEISTEIDRLNLNFSNPEQIKKFSILPRDEGELTPTLKIRRKQINDNWVDIINDMYAE